MNSGLLGLYFQNVVIEKGLFPKRVKGGDAFGGQTGGGHIHILPGYPKHMHRTDC